MPRQYVMQQRRSGPGKADKKYRAFFRRWHLQIAPTCHPLGREAVAGARAQRAGAVLSLTEEACVVGRQTVGLSKSGEGFRVPAATVEVPTALKEPVLAEGR